MQSSTNASCTIYSWFSREARFINWIDFILSKLRSHLTFCEMKASLPTPWGCCKDPMYRKCLFLNSMLLIALVINILRRSVFDPSSTAPCENISEDFPDVLTVQLGLNFLSSYLILAGPPWYLNNILYCCVERYISLLHLYSQRERSVSNWYYCPP